MANGDTQIDPSSEAQGLEPSPKTPTGPSAMETLKNLGRAFSGIGMQQSNAQAWQEYNARKAEAEGIVGWFHDQADKGNAALFQDPKALQKRYGNLIGSSWFEQTFPLIKMQAEKQDMINKNQQFAKQAATALGISQQRGAKLGPVTGPGGQQIDPMRSVLDAGIKAGIDPKDLAEKTGLQIAPKKSSGDLDDRASSHGYQSYKDAPLNVQKQIMHESDTAGKETPAEAGEKAFAAESGRIRADTAAGLTADGSAPSVPIGVSPSPGKLPTMLNYKGFASAHPELPPKQLPAAYKQEQGKYKKEVDDIRLVETAENGAQKAANDLLDFMDKHKMNSGGALAVPGSLIRGYAKNLTSKEQLTLRDKVGQFRAAAMPGYLNKGGPRSLAYLQDVSSHLPNVTDTEQTIRQQSHDFFPFIHNQITAAHQTIAGNFGIDYKEGEAPSLGSPSPASAESAPPIAVDAKGNRMQYKDGKWEPVNAK